MKSRLIFLALIVITAAQTARCQRIKDIVDIQGIRGNPLTGVGLVIGLAGTGDSTTPSQQMLTNIFRDSGITLTPDDFGGKNIAIVIVTADLGPFSRRGSRIDVAVSSVGDAKSLKGGQLLPVSLKGLDGKNLDGQVYAIAKGSISIAGWTASGDNASITKNHQTVGTISGGATVEQEEIATFIEHLSGERFITLNLRNNDFTTAEQISITINEIYPGSSAAIDAGTIKVKIPHEITWAGVVSFIDEITKPTVSVDMPAIVVINERTGTIIVGEHVGISPQAIAQGSLVVKVNEKELVSQPPAMFSDAGSTEIIQDTLLEIDEAEGILIPVPHIITVSDLARSLNAIGATPTDLIAIFNALKRAGALQAKLEIM